MRLKKLLATTFGVMLLALVFFAAFEMQTEAADVTKIAIGDVNADGEVDAQDALTVLKVTAGMTEDYVERVADVNGDAAIDASDALNILKYVAGMGSADELLKYTFIRVPEREDKCLSISSLEQKNITMSNAKIITYNGEMTYEKQKVIYTLNPSYSGNYRLDFTGMISGLSVDVNIYDSSGYVAASSSAGVRNDNGITASLKAGETYKIYVTQGLFPDYYDLYGQL